MSLFDAYVWIQDNWKSLGWPFAVLFAFLWWNKGCPKVEAPVTVTQAQTSKSDCTGKVKYIPQIVEAPGEAPKPLPCPAIEIDFSAGSSQTHWQSVTTSAQIEPRTNVGIYAGAGYLGTPVATLGGFYGPWRVGAIASTTAIGGLASYDIRF